MSMVDVAKSGARVSASQHFVGRLFAIARDHLVRSLCTSWPGACVSKNCARGTTCVFHSYLIRESARQCKRTARARDVLALGPRQ